MTRKPLGSKSLGGKRARFLEVDQTTAKMGDRLRQPLDEGKIADQRNLLVSEVRPDPEQHRRININMAMLKDPDLAPDKETRRQAEGIIALSQSIVVNGQVSPIDVYQEGNFFRILEGERRYWAVRLAGFQTIYAVVRYSKPENIYGLQLSYNVARENLEQRELLVLVRRLWETAIRKETPISSPADLAARAGLSKNKGYRWWRVLTEGRDIEDALLDGRIGTTRSIDRLLSLPSNEREAAINVLSEIERPGEEGVDNEAWDELEREKAKTKYKSTTPYIKPRPGRPAAYRFGQSTNRDVAKVVYERLTGKQNVDWTDAKAGTAAFKEAIAAIEKELILKR